MTEDDRRALTMSKLLRIARQRTDETVRRVAELEAAIEATKSSLQRLAASVAAEEASARTADAAGFAQLSGFLAGAAKKRAALEATNRQLASEIDRAKSELEDCFAEMKKLEHLIARARSAERTRRRRGEAASIDESALSRFVRTNRR